MAVRISRNIDWLSLTFPDGEGPYALWPHDEFIQIGKGLHGYKAMAQSQFYGVLVQWQGAMDMGTHMVFSGDALALVRQTLGRGLVPVFAVVKGHRGRASRIDLAIDIFNGGLTPAMAHKDLRSGKLKTGARAWRFVQGNTEGVNGDTLYLGSRDSEQFFRIYDKRAEQGIVDGEAQLRLECELKGMKARAALENCMQYGIDATSVGVFEQAMQWDRPDYGAALDAPGVALPELPRRETQTEKWLMSQVIPPLAKMIRIQPSFQQKFNDRLSAELRRLEAIQRGELTKD